MGAASTTHPLRDLSDEPGRVTLLDLVRAVGEFAKDEHEIVATVHHMLRTGAVRLGGSFRDVPIDER